MLGHRPQHYGRSSEARLVSSTAVSKGPTCGFGKGRAELPCFFAVPAPQRRSPVPTDRSPSPASYSLPRFGDPQEVAPRLLAAWLGGRRPKAAGDCAHLQSRGTSGRWTFSPQ